MTLKERLTEWVTDYKDIAERNDLAEDPNESAEYLIGLFKVEVDKLTVIPEKDIKASGFVDVFDSTTTGIELFRICKEEGFIEAQLNHTKKQLLDLMEE